MSMSIGVDGRHRRGTTGPEHALEIVNERASPFRAVASLLRRKLSDRLFRHDARGDASADGLQDRRRERERFDAYRGSDGRACTQQIRRIRCCHGARSQGVCVQV
jgi:hypothetical protein